MFLNWSPGMNISSSIFKRGPAILAGALILSSSHRFSSNQDCIAQALAVRDFDLVIGISAKHVSKHHRQSIVRIRGRFLYLSVSPHTNSKIKAALAEFPIDSGATISKIEDNGRIFKVTLSDSNGLTFSYMQMLEEGQNYDGLITKGDEPTQQS